MVAWIFSASAINIEHRDFMYDHVGAEQGLPSQRVYSLAEDCNGAVWASHKNGVTRCNGRILENYTLDNDDKAIDTGGLVIKLLRLPGERLMAYDNKGKLFVYEEALDRFITTFPEFTQHLAKINKTHGDVILKDISIDGDNTLWASTSKGMFRISADGKTFKRYHNNLYVNSATIADNHIVLCSTTGSLLIDRKTMKTVKKLCNCNTEMAFYDDKARKLWLGTFNNGAIVMSTTTWQPLEVDHRLKEIHNPIRAIELLNNDYILLGIDGGGVYAATRDADDSRLLFVSDEKTDYVLHGNGIYDILRDAYGNIWIGSYTGGIDVAYLTGEIIQPVGHKTGNEQSLICNGVNALIEVGETMVYGTDRGVSFYDRKKKLWTHTLQGKVVLALCKHNGTILAGTYGEGVFAISQDGKSTQLYCAENKKIATNYVYSLWQDRKGGLWIGCLDGDLVHVASNGTHRHKIQTVQSISDMPDGRVAVCTANGFYAINPQDGTTNYYFSPEELQGRNINSYVTGALFTGNNTAWVATDGGGIYKYNLSSRQLTPINQANGLPSNSVSALCLDPKGRIVVSTDHGLAIIIPSSNELYNINFIKGAKKEYNRNAVAALADGHIAFGSNSGAVIINPALIDKLQYETRLRFMPLNVEGDKELGDAEKEDIYKQYIDGSVVLDYTNNSFQVSYESIFYRYNDDILYQYKLQGFDNVWSEPSSESSVRFSNLEPGKYILTVRSISRNDGRVLDTKTLEIRIRQPWWNTIWAWIVYLAIAFYVVYLALKNYQGKLERRYFNEKIDFFVNAAHEIRTPLSLVLAPLNDVAADKGLSDNSRQMLDIAKTNGDKLYGMISELLDFQKADILGNSLKRIPMKVNDLLKVNAERFASLAKEKDICLDVEQTDDDAVVEMDVRLADKLFNNLISNAIKYTPEGGKVVLKAWTEDKKVKIEVSDNGMGIPKADQKNIFNSFYRAENAVESNITGTGIGLMLVRRIVNIHGGKLSFKSEGEGKGASFVVTLNRSEAHRTSNAKNEPTEIKEAYIDNNGEETAEKQNDIILFVDDNADLRQYFSITFTDSFRVVTVDSGEAALEYLKDNVCDIVVSDAMMPGMQGEELCRRIKDDADTSWMPVILLTAKAGKQFMIQGLDCGADDYVTKPFDTEVLKSKIRSTLINRRRMSQYYLKRVEAINQGTTTETADVTASDDTGDKKDVAFIDDATHIVLNNLADTEFGIDELCREMAMSRTLFYGRLKTLTGKTPQDFVRGIRLDRAAALLKQQTPIIDVCAMTGFQNTKHFSTVFKKHFGVSPSKY